MTSTDIVGFVILMIVALSLIGLSGPLLMGKGAWLVAGYNTMSAQEKAQWDGPALARFTGKILLACGLATILYGVGLFCFSLPWITWVYLVLLLGLCGFAVAWCNTGGRFRK